MALRLAVEITGDSRGLKTAATEGAGAVRQIGEAARISDADVRKLEQDAERAAQAAMRAANRAATNTASAVNLRLGVQTDFGSAARSADIIAFGRELDDTRAKFSPLFAAQREYKAQLAEIREAHRLGAISANEQAAAIERTKAAFARQVQGIRGGASPAGGGMTDGQANARRQVLMAQNFDVFTSLMGGMNPLMIAAQQGPQYVQAFGGFKETVEAARGALTATRLAMLGLTGTVLAGAVAWNSYLNSTKQVETAAAGLGRGSGATVGELDQIAKSAAAAAGISVKEARELETALLRTGKIGADAFLPIIAMSKDFAATMGTDLASAGQKLAEIFADPARGAAQLHEQYGLISGAQARYVQQLVRQGEADKARIALLEALNGRLVNARQATTALAWAWEAVANAASNANQAVGEWIDRQAGKETPAQELARLRAADAGSSFDPTLDFDLTGGRAKRIRELEEMLEQEKKKAEAERQRKLDADAGTLAIGVAAASPANALALRRRDLDAEIKNLEAGRGKPGVTAEEDARIARAIDAKKNALDGLSRATTRQAELDQIDLQLMQARDPIERARLERQKALIAGREEETVSTERATAANDAYARALNQALAETGNRVADMRAETAARAAVNDAVAAGGVSLQEAEEQIRLEMTLRPLVQAMLKAEGAEREALARAIDAERNAYAAAREERSRSRVPGILQGQADEYARARLEQSLIGATNEERERAIQLLEAEQRIRDAGIASSSAEANAIRANARAIADLNSQVDRQKAAYAEVSAFGERSIDTVTEKVREQGLSFKTLGDSVTSIANDMQAEFYKLAVANPLKNALLGQSNPTLGDVGGALSSMFGGQKTSAEAKVAAAIQSTASMTVTAGTVILNGGVAGGSGVASALAGATGPVANDRVAGALAGTPKAFDLAASLTGMHERTNGSEINSFLAKGGVDIDAARTKWCAAFVNSGLEQVGVKGTGSLTANSFLKWGSSVKPADVAKGDVLVQPNGFGPGQAGGHVGFATGQSRMGPRGLQLEMLSGNASNKVAQDWRDASALEVRRAAAPAANAAAAGVDPAAAQAVNTSLTGLAKTAEQANTGVTGFSGAMDKTAAQVANAATGVGGSAQQLAQTTATVPGEAQGLFQTLFSTLGSGLDKLFSALGGGGAGGGGGLLGSIASIFTGGGGAAAAPAVAAASASASPAVAAAASAPAAAAARMGGQASGPRTVNVINPAGMPLEAQVKDVDLPTGEQGLEVRLQRVVAQGVRTSGSPIDKANREKYGLKPVLTPR